MSVSCSMRVASRWRDCSSNCSEVQPAAARRRYSVAMYAELGGNHFIAAMAAQHAGLNGVLHVAEKVGRLVGSQRLQLLFQERGELRVCALSCAI